MDEIEHGPLVQIPAAALNLTLTRSTIKMLHSASWSVEKTNSVYDLVICLEGRGDYLIDDERLWLEPGEAMLVPPHTRFVGWNTGPIYTGIAQHFSLEIFGSTDFLAQMVLRRKIRFSKWPMIAPLVTHFRQTAPPSSVTLAQHHSFMVMLLAFVDDAFIEWRDQTSFAPTAAAAIDLAVTVAASRIAAKPLEDGIAGKVVLEAPFNPDYFIRAFQKRIGRTPRKFQDFKRIERAMHLLEAGHAVGNAGAEVGYTDPYYFSRLFKRVTGMAPRDYIRRVEQARDGSLLHLDELQQIIALRAAGIMPRIE